MANPFKGMVAAGIVGGLAWALREYMAGQDADATPVIMPASAPGPAPTPAPRNAFAGALLDNLFGVLGTATGGAVQIPNPINVAQPAVTGALGGIIRQGGGAGSVSTLLGMIRRHESRNNYAAYWSGIKSADAPPKALTSMTIAEVLLWQDRIDARYNSEAAGAYQILEDTLRGLYGSAGLSASAKFNPANQDRLAMALLERRGLSKYKAGVITDVQFAQNLAMEWASFPAQTRDAKGRTATGQSYYAGDGLNKSLTSQAEVLAAVRKI